MPLMLKLQTPRLALMVLVGSTITGAGNRLAVQDWYGLDGWIELTREHWVEMSPLWGVALALFGLWIFSRAVKSYALQELRCMKTTAQPATEITYTVDGMTLIFDTSLDSPDTDRFNPSVAVVESDTGETIWNSIPLNVFMSFYEYEPNERASTISDLASGGVCRRYGFAVTTDLACI